MTVVYFNCVYNELAYFKDPRHVVNDTNSFRTHLVHCLINSKTTSFPKQTINRVRRCRAKQFRIKLYSIPGMRDNNMQHENDRTIECCNCFDWFHENLEDVHYIFLDRKKYSKS